MKKVFLIFIVVFLMMGISLFGKADEQKLPDHPSDGLAPYRANFNTTDQKNVSSSLFRDPVFEGYAYNAYDPTSAIPLGPIYFPGDDPASVTLLAPTSSTNFIAGACWIADTETWYGCEYGGGLWTIDHTNGAMTYVAATTEGYQGLAFDDATGTMYATDGTSLYTLDMNTGASALIGSHNVAMTMIGIACDGEGSIYGVTVDFTAISDLYMIDTVTGNATSLGSTGGQLLYAQDLAYDKDNGVLYSSAYFGDGTPPGLYEINTSTAAMTPWGDFPGGMEVSGFAIPYSLAEAGAPAEPTDFVVTPDAGGALSCDLSWTNPTLTFDGNPLTELLEMRVYRGDDLVYTDSSPVIGGAGSYTDNPAIPDLYNYTVVGYNSDGEGDAISAEVWIGEDIPSAITDLVLTDGSTRDLAGQLNWVNPTEGFHGGYFSGVTGYEITRSDGETFDIAGPITDWLDETIPMEGIYSYTFYPYNDGGFGPPTTSNTAGIGISVIEIGNMEVTDYQIPMNIWYQNSVVEVVYPMEWIGTDMAINAIAFHANISSADINAFNFELWIGEHDVDDLTGGWIDGNSMTQVFSDMIVTPAGDYWFEIPFDMPFEYTYQSNLVLMMVRDDDEYYSTSDLWYTTESGTPMRTLHQYSDVTDFSAFGPWENTYDKSTYPDVRIYFSSLEHGSVEGIVTDSDSGDPIEGAEVWIGNYPSVLTNAAGEYSIEDIFVGTLDIFGIADGYYLYEGVVEVLANETVVHDIALDANQFGAIDGTVTDEGNGTPLVGAAIHAMSDDGYEYNTTTNNDGYYLIDNVVVDYYDVTCSYPMYPTYIEENVEVTDGATVTVDFELPGYTYWSDFETNDGGLISDNPGAGWQWGTPTNGPLNAYSGVNLWGTNIAVNYDNGLNVRLDTPQSYQLQAGIPWLEFWHWYDIEASWDGGNVKISTDGGSSWTVIEPLTGYPGTANTSNPLNGEPIFDGHNQGFWEFVQFDLSAYAGESVMFRWHFGSDGSVQYPGWFIDNVSLSGGAPPEYGNLDGYVTEFSTGTSIEGATITCGGYMGTSGADGYYVINNIMTSTYDVTCSAPGYIDEISYNVDINADETTDLDFELTWVEIAVDPGSFDVNVPLNETLEVPMTITNDGTSDLEFNISIAEQGLMSDNADDIINISVPVHTSFDQSPFMRPNPKRAGWAQNLGYEYQSSAHKGLSYTRDRNISVLLLSPDGDDPVSNLEIALTNFVDLDVTVFPNADLATISLGDITDYDVVVVYNDLTWDNAGTDATTIGNLLADYIDVGGKVVDNMYLHSFDQWGLAGRYIDEQYAPFTTATMDNWNPTELGTVHEPDHPIMAGVASAGQSWGVQDPGLAAGAVQIADWDDGNILVAANDNVVGINIMPVDPNSGPTWSGDIPTMYHNAIVWIGSPITWLTANPIFGTVSAGSSEDVAMTFNSMDLVEGEVYSANIIITNNAGMGDNVIIPASMTVGPDSVDEPEMTTFVTMLGTNHPNPFTPETRISFSLSKTSEVNIGVYNVRGEKVKDLVSEKKDSGDHTAVWYGKDNNGKDVASGVYFYKMKAGRYTSTKKMILMK